MSLLKDLPIRDPLGFVERLPQDLSVGNHRPIGRTRATAIAAFVVYLCSLGFGVSQHEPWADEVQSWLLARDLSPFGLAVHQLRYEGSPGLWQILLWPFAHAHLPIMTLNLVGAVVAAAGVFAVIFVSPFPLFFRVFIPLSYYPLYQYGVVSRSYDLLLPLLCAAAITHKHRFEKRFQYTLVLCALAAVSVQSMLIAGTLFVLYLSEGYRQSASRRDFDQSFRSRLLLFGAVNAAFVAVLWPTKDDAAHVFSSGLGAHPIHLLGTTASLLATKSFTGVAVLNVGLMIAAGIWLYERRRLACFVLPVLAATLFVATLNPTNASLWLQGSDTLLLIFALWIGFDSQDRRRHLILKTAPIHLLLTLPLFVLVLGIQTIWSAAALSWDATHAYGPAAAAAAFLTANNLERDQIGTDGSYYSVDLEPYLPAGRFVNLPAPGAFFHWSRVQDLDVSLYRPIAKGRVQVLILSVWGLGPDRGTGRPKWANYRLVARFPGQVFWHTKVVEHEDLLIYLRKDVTLPSAS